MVVAAFFDSGGLKAGTPFAMASSPVRAEQPEEKARSINRILSDPAVAVTATGCSGAYPDLCDRTAGRQIVSEVHDPESRFFPQESF